MWRALRILGALDVFQGWGNYQRCCEERGVQCEGFDLRLGHDCTSPKGRITFKRMARRCRRGSVALIGPPCQYYIFLTRSRHGKTIRHPSGNRSKFSKQGNAIARFVAWAVRLCSMWEISWVIEQPQTSVLFYNRYLRAELRRNGGKRVHWRMGVVGGSTPKPSVGWFSSPTAASQFQSRTQALFKAQAKRRRQSEFAYTRGAKGDVRGNGLTKRSSRYPKRFCKLILQCHGIGP